MGNNNLTSLIKQKALGIILVVSLLVNIGLAVNYVNVASRLNTTWRNSISQLAKVTFWLLDDYQENPSLEDLERVNGKTQLLFQQVETIQELPYGSDIMPFETVKKIMSLINDESQVVELMQTELKQSGHVSVENLRRWQVINEGWRSMFKPLNEENNKTDPFSPIFRKKVWQKVLVNAVNNLDNVEPVILPIK